MTKTQLAQGVVHKVAADLRRVLASDPAMRAIWEDITPLARNEWLCWIEDAKKSETRARRIRIARENLKSDKRRPCCWPGCPHRSNKKRKI